MSSKPLKISTFSVHQIFFRLLLSFIRACRASHTRNLKTNFLVKHSSRALSHSILMSNFDDNPQASLQVDKTLRVKPNILVTGTPGTGKTTTCELIAQATNLEHICIGDLVKERGLHEGYDEDFGSYIHDDDKICDELEEPMSEGGKVIDFHSCELFPERWFDLVLVLRTDNTILYDRLAKRNYTPRKITENIECEIMQVVLDEARESYAEEIVIELRSDNVEEMESNVDRVRQWVESYRAKHRGSVHLQSL